MIYVAWCRDCNKVVAAQGSPITVTEHVVEVDGVPVTHTNIGHFSANGSYELLLNAAGSDGIMGHIDNIYGSFMV